MVCFSMSTPSQSLRLHVTIYKDIYNKENDSRIQLLIFNVV